MNYSKRLCLFFITIAVLVSPSLLLAQPILGKPKMHFLPSRMIGLDREFKWTATPGGGYWGFKKAKFGPAIFSEKHVTLPSGAFSGWPKSTSVVWYGTSPAVVSGSSVILGQELLVTTSTDGEAGGLRTGSDYEYRTHTVDPALPDPTLKPHYSIERISQWKAMSAFAKEALFTTRTYELIDQTRFFDVLESGRLIRETSQRRHINGQRVERFIAWRESKITDEELDHHSYDLDFFGMDEAKELEVESKYTYYLGVGRKPDALPHVGVETFELWVRFEKLDHEMHLKVYYDRAGDITELKAYDGWQDDIDLLPPQLPLVPLPTSSEAFAIDIALHFLNEYRINHDTWWSTHIVPELRDNKQGLWGDIMPKDYMQILNPGMGGMSNPGGGNGDPNGGENSDDGGEGNGAGME